MELRKKIIDIVQEHVACMGKRVTATTLLKDLYFTASDYVELYQELQENDIFVSYDKLTDCKGVSDVISLVV